MSHLESGELIGIIYITVEIVKIILGHLFPIKAKLVNSQSDQLRDLHTWSKLENLVREIKKD